MKKVLFSMLALSTVASANNFAGTFVAYNIGAAKHSNKQKDKDGTVSSRVEVKKLSKSKVSLDQSIEFGHLFAVQKFNLGGGLVINHTSGKATKRTTTATNVFNSTVERGLGYGLFLLGGYEVSSKGQVFAKATILKAKTKNSYTATTIAGANVASFKQKKSSVSYRLDLGYEHKVANNISISGSVGFIKAKKIQLPFGVEFNSTAPVANVGVKYAF